MKEGLRPEQQQNPEKSKKQYGELDASQKVKAVAAMLQEPLGRETILHIAEVDASKLKEKERESVEEVFKSTKAEGSDKFPRYWVTPDKQQEVLDKVGVEKNSVSEQMLAVARKDSVRMFGEDLFERFGKIDKK